MKDEEAIEAELQAKGKTAPRMTPSGIEAVICAENYVQPAKWTDAPVTDGMKCLTICILTLRNGFTVTGESACASPENFDEELGKKIARDKAREKIWPLEGYRLREQLFQEESRRRAQALLG